MDVTVVNAIPTWSYTPLKRTFPSDDPFFQVREFIKGAISGEDLELSVIITQ